MPDNRDEATSRSGGNDYSYPTGRGAMQYTKIRLIYFSPTRTSQKVVTAVGSGFSGVEVENIDLTYPDSRQEVQLGAGELAIVGIPVYAGRVAAPAVERFKAIKGNTRLPFLLCCTATGNMKMP